MFLIRDWFLANKSEKTVDWANRVIKNIRWSMQPLVNSEEALTGMDYLLARQDHSWLKDLFQNTTKINLTNEKVIFDHRGHKVNGNEGHDRFMQAEMAGAYFKPLPLLEKAFRISIAEMKKMGVPITVISNDPTSSDQRKKDESLLKNRRKIEKELSDVYTKIGKPPVKMDHYESRFGEKAAAGNIDDFDKMGLDDGDPQDINQFMKHFHKLLQEMAAQGVIDYVMADNEIANMVELWVADIWAKKAIAAAYHISDVSGRPTCDYIAPETIWIYGGGRRKDYNDANAKAYQQKISVKEFIDRFGNSFDFENDWDQLLMSITFAGTSLECTGIFPSWQGLSTGDQWVSKGGGNRYGINDFLAFKVTVGYIEWTSQNQETFGEVKKNTSGEYYEDNQPPNGERYQTKARFETPTYKSFYLAVSNVTQVLFNFGEMTYQQIEGYNDFNSNFSIITWKEIGDPLALMARQFIDIIHEAWFKFKFLIRRAKGPGVAYNYQAVLAMAEDIFIDTELTRDAKLDKFVAFLDSSSNSFWSYPYDQGGNMITQGINSLHVAIPNGLPADIKVLWDIITSNLDEMQDVLTGKAPLRQGDPGGSRDSMNNQFKALEYSQNATAYIPDMLTFMFEQLAKKTMLFVQDIIQFKNYDTLAYKYLVDAVGEDKLDCIKGLGRKAMHRYGIFVESLNQTVQRAKLSQRIDFALQNGKITNAQALLVEDIKSPMEAFLWLSYFEEKTAKNAQKMAMQSQQQVQQGAMQLKQMDIQLERIKGDYLIQGKQIDADAGKQEHIINAQSGIIKQAMKHTSDVIQIEEQAKADLKTESQSIDATGKQNPQPAGMVPTGGPAPQSNAAPSGISQLINSSQPTSTQGAQPGQPG